MKSNVNYIREKYDKVLNSHFQYVLIEMNIKNFRYYNTKYGHRAGDEILEAVLNQLLSLIDKDEYVAHLSTDNYALLLKYKDKHELIYERMMKMIDDLYRIQDERIFRNLFLSFGFYYMDDKDVDFYDALNLANLCRKESDSLNSRTSNMEIYDQSIHQQYMNRIDLEMKTADAYKNYEFISYLQPKVDMETEEIVGAEALLRWIDKDGQIIPLYQFLPILNQNKYIQLIDLDIFDQICKKIDQRLKNNQKVVPVSFNMSKPLFYSETILEDYIKIFEKYDIPKKYIEIELMESISLDDTERMKEVVSGFKEYGFVCSLDDFGSGYSSFNVLLNAPFDIIKMDRQFFLDNLKGNNKLIIQTVVNLIHSLGMKVVAEGVEMEEHIDYLKECGCDVVQGFYYYKPMSIEDFELLIDKK